MSDVAVRLSSPKSLAKSEALGKRRALGRLRSFSQFLHCEIQTRHVLNRKDGGALSDPVDQAGQDPAGPEL